MRAGTASATALAALVAGCGASPQAPPPTCGAGPATVLHALAAAPGAVRLVDGTALSTCVERSVTDSDVQELGYTLTAVADGLARKGTPLAAVQLGYLVGAVQRGAARSNGVQTELARRLQSTIGFQATVLIAAARRGYAAGQTTG